MKEKIEDQNQQTINNKPEKRSNDDRRKTQIRCLDSYNNKREKLRRTDDKGTAKRILEDSSDNEPVDKLAPDEKPDLFKNCKWK